MVFLHLVLSTKYYKNSFLRKNQAGYMQYKFKDQTEGRKN